MFHTWEMRVEDDGTRCASKPERKMLPTTYQQEWCRLRSCSLCCPSSSWKRTACGTSSSSSCPSWVMGPPWLVNPAETFIRMSSFCIFRRRRFFFRGHLFIHYLTLGQAALPGQDGRKLQMQAQHSIPSSKENSGHPTSVRLRQLAVVTAACPIPSHLHVSNVISLLIVMQWWRMQNFCQGSLFKPLNFQQPRNIRPTQTVVHMFNRVFTHKDKTPGPSKNRLICNTRALPPCYCVPPAFHHRWHCPWDPTWRGSLACPHHLHLRTYTQLVTKERGGDRGPCPTASGLFSWWHTYLVTKRVGGWERPMSHYQEPVLLCQTLFYVLIHKEDSKIINSIHFNCESVIQSMQFNCESML